MVFSCTACSFCCNSRLDMIKHSFGTHSVEPTFHLVCGIRGCLHSFRFGSTFSSFKTHASRKHMNWQHELNESCEATPTPLIEVPVPVSENLAETRQEEFTNDDLSRRSELELLRSNVCTLHSRLSAKRSAALFLLTLKERYKLSQTAINFAVGSINGIVDSVCESLQESVQSSLDIGKGCSDVTACFNEREDPFILLQTEYKQSKFYREEFGLVVRFFARIYDMYSCNFSVVL